MLVVVEFQDGLQIDITNTLELGALPRIGDSVVLRATPSNRYRIVNVIWRVDQQRGKDITKVVLELRADETN